MASPSVQSNTSTTSGPQASDTVTLSAGTGHADVTAGNCLVLSVFSDGAPASVTGSPDTWGGPAVTIADGGNWVSLYFIQSAVGGATSATVHYSPNADDIITLIEYKPTPGIHNVGSFAEAGVSSTNPAVPLSGISSGDTCVYLICGAGTAQTVGNVGTNPANVIEQLLSDILTADGISSGASINCTSTGATAFWLGVALALKQAAPIITSQPQNITVYVGQTATFSVTATSSGGALSYQWNLNGSPIGGATSSSYTTPATVLSDSGGVFTVTVTDSNGSTLSNNAILTVLVAASLFWIRA